MGWAGWRVGKGRRRRASGWMKRRRKREAKRGRRKAGSANGTGGWVPLTLEWYSVGETSPPAVMCLEESRDHGSGSGNGDEAGRHLPRTSLGAPYDIEHGDAALQCCSMLKQNNRMTIVPYLRITAPLTPVNIDLDTPTAISPHTYASLMHSEQVGPLLPCMWYCIFRRRAPAKGAGYRANGVSVRCGCCS